MTAVGADHRLSDGAQDQPLAVCRLLDHERQLVGGEHVAEIDQHAGDRRDGDASAGRHVAGVQPAAVVEADAGHRPVPPRDDHVGVAERESVEPQDQRGDAEVAEHGARAAREDCREPASFL